MRVRVAADVCVGHGRCYVLASDVYAPDEHGHCVVVVDHVEGALAEQARAGAANCPESAITIDDA